MLVHTMAKTYVSFDTDIFTNFYNSVSIAFTYLSCLVF